jgi:hypothetical protein
MREVATHALQQVFQNKIYCYYFLKLQQVLLLRDLKQTMDHQVRMHLKVPSSSVHCWDYIVDMKAQNVPRHVEISIHWHVETFATSYSELNCFPSLPLLQSFRDKIDHDTRLQLKL